MSSPTGAFSPLLVSRGVDLAALGVAYLAFLASGLLAAGGFVAARQYLVISPNRWTRDYGIHASWLLATLLIAIVLENELTKAGAATTHYVAMPQLLVLLGLHAWIWNRRDPTNSDLRRLSTGKKPANGNRSGKTFFRPQGRD